MDLRFISNEAEFDLVELRRILALDRKKVIFATISPNPNVKIVITKKRNGRTITCKLPYGKLPQKVQYDYCLKILRAAYYYSDETIIYGTWELNKTANVHFHFLMYDPHLINDTQLQIFRRDVMNTSIVMDNLSKNMIDYCNNIVFVNDTIRDRLAYIHKEKDTNMTIFPYYCTSNLYTAQQSDVKGSGESPAG